MTAYDKDILKDLSAFIDGELSPQRTAEIAELVEKDPQLASELQSLRATRDLLGELPRKNAKEDFAAAILENAERNRLLKSHAHRQRKIAPVWIKISASAAIIFITCGLVLYVTDTFNREDWVSRLEEKRSADTIRLTADTDRPQPTKETSPAELKNMLKLTYRDIPPARELELSLDAAAPAIAAKEKSKLNITLEAPAETAVSQMPLAARSTGASITLNESVNAKKSSDGFAQWRMRCNRIEADSIKTRQISIPEFSTCAAYLSPEAKAYFAANLSIQALTADSAEDVDAVLTKKVNQFKHDINRDLIYNRTRLSDETE